MLDLLVTERDDTLAEVTRLRNQIHRLLMQLDPAYQTRLPKLRTKAGLRAVEAYTSGTDDLQQQRAAAVRRLAQRLRLALEQVADLTKQIRARARSRYAALGRV